MDKLIKTPEENITNLLSGKKVLFLENDNTLNGGVETFQQILEKNAVEHTILFDLSEQPSVEIIKQINSHDSIVFQTTWLSEISKTLFEYISNLEKKLIVVQVYRKDPTWYYSSQHGTHHDVYIFNGMEYLEHEFYKLTESPYWDYENKFDK